MEQEQPKKKKLGWALDKLVMGVIIGGAIGSVLGMVFAPQKGKETRKILKEKGKEIYDKHEGEIKDFTKKAKKESKNIFESIKKRFYGNEEKNEEKKIPTENLEQ